MQESFQNFKLDYDTPVNPVLQNQLETVDAKIRAQLGMTSGHTAAGLIDAQTSRLAMLRPDSEYYAASVAKIGILLAYFKLRSAGADKLDSTTRHDLGLMIKASSNEMAAKFSRQLG